jgi:hypothetical protein
MIGYPTLLRHEGPAGTPYPFTDYNCQTHGTRRRNPRFGCPRIAQQINMAFGTHIDKDIVRRVLANFYRPVSGGKGPSWLTFLDHTKDSLWSIDRV